MGTINFRKMDAAAAELSAGAKQLRSLQVRLEELFKKQSQESIPVLQDPAQKEDSGNASGKTENGFCAADSEKYSLSGRDAEKYAEMLFKEADALEKASAVLREAVRMYRQAEARVLDIYDGELVVVPRTVFGTSHFENLRSYESFIPIRPGSSSKADARCGNAGSGIVGQAGAETGESQEMKSLEGIL
ncbi:MAG: hypothetical protein Q4C02_01640 [Eubacteriales bacterium]|nr:hypothetical protein [Eubacteriales bacterium]